MPYSMASENAISSPCNRVCVMHPASRICVGCGRSLDEIARWATLSEAERLAIMARLPARLAALTAGNAAPAAS
jgi:predicted Fe-S protein YdhL (DUF1289 family)